MIVSFMVDQSRNSRSWNPGLDEAREKVRAIRRAAEEKTLDPRKLEEIRRFKQKSRPLEELIVTENFTVNEVFREDNSILLKVTPDNDILVRILRFMGFLRVRAGDYISATIPKYEENAYRKNFVDGKITYIIGYFGRDFKPEEEAIEIAILSSDGRVLRTDRADDYHERTAPREECCSFDPRELTPTMEEMFHPITI